MLTEYPAVFVLELDYLRTNECILGAIPYCGVQACFLEKMFLKVGSLKQ